MSQFQKTYQKLCDYSRETALLKSTLALLEWDQHTKLPVAATDYRSEQIAFLSGQIHQRSTAPQVGDWLSELSDSPLVADRESDAAANLDGLKRDYDRATRLPESLVQALAKAASTGQTQWIQSRADNDFESFAPHLTTLIRLKREQADALGFPEERYDALLDEYEPGARTADIASVLNGLCEDLVPLVAEIAHNGRRPDTSILRRHFPTEKQAAIGREASAAIGFDYQRGRLDVTHHPFCTELGPADCRITTRYDERFFSSSFFGTLHEAGHGIYEQGLRSSQYGLPLGSYCSLGIHESQSRLWENMVGRSASFWRYFYPRVQSSFEALEDVSEQSIYQAINDVSPSLIRVEADEATYNLHITIRFELERSLLDDQLPVAELPTAWNEKYQQYLGIAPDSNANGVLQDVHWAAGLFGYFPTYSLGNLYASQFFDAAERELGPLEPMFARGDFHPLKEWLNRHVHHPGRRWTGPELGERITGQPLSHAPLISYLKHKYEQIFAVSFQD